MKKRKMLVRAVSLFMVGLITTLALVIPTSAIMTEYPTEDNITNYNCVMPFNVNFVGTDGTLDYVYSVPVGYNSPVVQTGINGHDTLTGRVLGDGGVTPNAATLEYYYYSTEWRIGYDGIEYDDGWGGVPVELRIDNTEIDGKTIVIDAPTFYLNPLVSNWYRTADPDTYNRWSMGAFRMPTLADPSTHAYVGRYTVSANVVDDVGTKHPVSYSKVIDTRIDNNWNSFLEPSIFQDYVINSIQETGYNRIVAVTDFKAYVDCDYYEFVPDTPNNISLILHNVYYGDNPTTYTFAYNGDTLNDYVDIADNDGRRPITISDGNVCYDEVEYGYPKLYLEWNGTADVYGGVLSVPTTLSTNVYDGISLYYSGTHTGGSNDMGFGGYESPGAFDGDFDWGGALNESPSASPVSDTPVATAEGGDWRLVKNSPLKATGIDVSYPVYERNVFTEGEMALNYGYPDFDRYISKFRGVGNLDVNADFTGWIATATSGFLNFELLPNFSIGGVLAILVGFSLVILFLKEFAGG